MQYSVLFLEASAASDGGVLEKLSEIFNLLKGFFDDIASLGIMLGKFIVNLPSYFAWLPTEAVTILIFGFTVVIALRLAGRSS